MPELYGDELPPRQIGRGKWEFLTDGKAWTFTWDEIKPGFDHRDREYARQLIRSRIHKWARSVGRRIETQFHPDETGIVVRCPLVEGDSEEER